MRILIANSFPIPGDYDGTAMLPIKILRALKPRGVRRRGGASARAPAVGNEHPRGEFEDTPVYTVPPAAWLSGGGAQEDRPRASVRAGARPALRRGDAGVVCMPAVRWPMVYEIHSLLGEEVERDRLGRGLSFRVYQALERKVFAARGRGDRPG